jgi:hypothetical protein
MNVASQVNEMLISFEALGITIIHLQVICKQNKLKLNFKTPKLPQAM